MPGQLVVTVWMCIITFAAVKIMGSAKLSFIDKLDTRKKNSLDALRCFLAIAVVFHHFMFNYFYSTAGQWSIQGYNVNAFLGRFGVFMFFMVSGYLFSNIGINNIKWWITFFIKRFLRIAPMCLVSSILCIIIAFIYGDNKTVVYHDLIKWLDAGVLNYRPDLFGLENSDLINAGVTWTLRREWGLYFSLPLLALLIPQKKRKAAATVVAIVTYVWFCVFKSSRIEENNQMLLSIFFFAIGFLSKHLKSKTVTKIALNRKFQLLLTVALCLTAVAGKPAAAPGIMFIAMLFIAICNGFTLFGLLNSKGAIRLGEISYSIYLIHGIVWYLMFKVTGATDFILLKSSMAFFVIIALAIFFYAKIEKPIYNLSKIREKKHNDGSGIKTI